MKQEHDFSAGKRGRFFREGAKLRIPVSDAASGWAGPSGRIGRFISKEAQKSLDAYHQQPRLVSEHAHSEQDTALGGYAHRQVFELVQNSADAVLDSARGRSILVRLTTGFLYCADNGTPIDADGVAGLMFDRMSKKRNTAAIGRFGRGFKSVLRVTDAPHFFSRTGSFRFDKERAERRIAKVASIDHGYPVLRLPEPIDCCEERDKDEDLRELMGWASNIVRLPLKPDAHAGLSRQIREFPPEFLLFVDHVRHLTLEDEDGSREFMLHRENGELRLETGDEHGRWRRFDFTHQLSPTAQDDWHLHEGGDEVRLSWAVPIDRLDRPGQFWAFFPTDTASLVAGILNAPWKTNEDRQNLLPGPYNEELIEAAAGMIARSVRQLGSNDDPARHLDALPRRHESGDTELVNLLREQLFSCLREGPVIPDQVGKVRSIRDISYPPTELTDGSGNDALDSWAGYTGRPRNWLHHMAITRNRKKRLAVIDRLFPPRWQGDENQSAPRESVATWLEALVEGKQASDAIEASKAAVRTAAAISPSKGKSSEELGRIVLLANDDWTSPNPERLFLPEGSLEDLGSAESSSSIHPKLASDLESLAALKSLGLKLPSAQSQFKQVAKRVLEGSGEVLNEGAYRAFWIASRKLSDEEALSITQEFKDWRGEQLWPSKLRVRTAAQDWCRLQSVLLPGAIVPGDGSRDKVATVDMDFHALDSKLLSRFGVTDMPSEDCELSTEPCYVEFLQYCRQQFTSRPLNRNPHSDRLVFRTSQGSGPLDVLARLSEEGNATYTNALLSLAGTFSRWTMRHETQQHMYPDLSCESLPISVLGKAGRIRTSSGAIIPIKDALGPNPKSPEALRALLAHPMADKIKAAFDLTEPTPEISGEGDAIPLADIWPGLKRYLPAHRQRCRLVPCERVTVMGQPRECVSRHPDICLTHAVQDGCLEELKLVLRELELDLSPEQVQAILLRNTPAEIEERRSAIRLCLTDAERLLAAIGAENLRRDLPNSLLAVLEPDGVSLSGIEVAEAAIATFHTDALKQYKWALDSLDPPSQWAGSQRAIAFVRSLGFSSDWAGERSARLDPFLEVLGRYRLPQLHGYQKVVVRNLREMLCSASSANTMRRGMVSLPTGSGKTRVAVQATVEAIRDGGFRGGVLWVADRSELCEQAVESWRQVWSGIGPQEARLRISRMWEGQPWPLPVTEPHVVVATIQTLRARLSNSQGHYDFLRDFKLVVFDEAHRSIAPTFTSVMEEIGLTRRQDADEPCLLGLTATPYRGYDEEETRWLANRYGGNRLDAGAFESDEAEDVIQELQSMGVLAQADHEMIEGETFSLDDVLRGTTHSGDWRQELERWKALPWLPQSVEDRIAGSAHRTKRIVEAYEEHIGSNWPTLIFATSVEHARTLAALLNRKGIRSRAVSGETETTTRRRIVEEFRSGEITALVNYGVFREGFDAPMTRAIIVARPVFSPNLYFQMIGRGLRGPRNGGNERCLILNVRDNIDSFDRSLAFSDLDWLWA